MKMEYQIKDIRQQCFNFAASVNADVRESGHELIFKHCPICRAKDENTFSLNTQTGQCNCFRASCSYKGNLVTLAREFENFNLDKESSAYYNLNNENAKKKVYRNFEPKTKVKAIEYLKTRGISERITKLYGITVHKDDSTRLVFPFVDENNDLVFIKYRKTDFVKGESFGSKEWCQKDMKPILFGINQCKYDVRELIITEGQIDSLSVAEAGYDNALSVPTGKNGFTWIPYCWNFINNFDTLIIFGDKENGSMTLLDDFKRIFYKKHIKYVRLEDYKDCKDANEILLKYGKEQIKTCIENAVNVPVRGLVDLADIKPLNRYEIEKLPTGFDELDKCLCGGLPFGSVIDITGKTGEGKSTIASWFIAQAIENNYKCLVYSGELDKSLFKEGLDRQLCGEKVKENPNKDYISYYIDEDDQAKINEWYRGKCYFYDVYSLAIDEQEMETASLTTKIEEGFTQYGIRVFLLDNLMTAMDQELGIEGSDKYEKQSRFMKRLISMAVRYQILIILVAHNRKDNSGGQNDNIAGTADIGNLASVTLDYTKAGKSKDPKKPFKDVNGIELRETQRVLRLGKNRFFSTLCLEGWGTEYDIKSNRVYINRNTKEQIFGWGLNENNMIEVDIRDLEIPF